ncbi:MAG: PEP-CTERM sorting domain-containing protein [Phycisphaerae bacterium]|nr:PEP-CTERM sorting domain-containing protein [Phycisphaerae bacterium]
MTKLLNMKSLSVVVVVLLAVGVQASADLIIEDGSTISDWSTGYPAVNTISQGGDASDYYLQIAVAASGDSNSSNCIEWDEAGNLDWSGYTSIEIDLKMSIATPTDRVRLRWQDGTGGWQNYITVTNTAGTDWGTYSFDITGFARSDVDRFLVYVNTNGVDVDYEVSIDDLKLVPEPATMVLLSLGGVGLLVRRRRRV